MVLIRVGHFVIQRGCCCYRSPEESWEHIKHRKLLAKRQRCRLLTIPCVVSTAICENLRTCFQLCPHVLGQCASVFLHGRRRRRADRRKVEMTVGRWGCTLLLRSL